MKIYTTLTSKSLHVPLTTRVRSDDNGKTQACPPFQLFYTATPTSLLGSVFLETFSFKLHLVAAEFKTCLLFAKGSFFDSSQVLRTSGKKSHHRRKYRRSKHNLGASHKGIIVVLPLRIAAILPEHGWNLA